MRFRQHSHHSDRGRSDLAKADTSTNSDPESADARGLSLNTTKGYTAHGIVRVDIKVYGFDMTARP